MAQTFSFEEATRKPETFSFEDAIGPGRPLPEGVTPSTAGAGRGETGGRPMRRAGGTRAEAQPFVGGDQRVAAPPPAPAPAPALVGGSVFDRVSPERVAELAPQQFNPAEGLQLSKGPAQLEQERLQGLRVQSAGSAPEARGLSMPQMLADDVANVSDNPVYRGAVSGFSELGRTGVGAVRLAADLAGATDVADFARGAAGAANAFSSQAGKGLAGNDKLVADVTASITTSLPAVALGMAGGPALRGLFAQSALAEYNSGRDAGFDVGESLARAGIYGTAEALGERFGFPEQIKLLRGVTRGMPSGELARTFASMFAKEVPGEQLTTAVQFLADKMGPAALNPNATLEDYFNAVGETFKVTVAQTAVMGGGPALISETRNQLRGADRAIERSAMNPAERAAVDAGFLRPTERRKAIDQRLDDFAAEHGVPPAAVKAIREQAQRKPLGEVVPWYKRALASLKKRGLVGGEVNDQTLSTLDDEAIPADDVLATGLADDVPRETPQPTPVDDGAHQAATSPANDLPEPTDGQKAAGNYKVGRARIAGLDISIENPEGSVRRGVDADGAPWETTMRAHYGYIRGSEAKDGDKLDVFIKPGTPEDYAGPVFVVDQIDPKTGKYDEAKAIIGAANEAEAEAIYRSNYAADWRGFGAVTGMPMGAFKAWAQSKQARRPLGDLNRGQPVGNVDTTTGALPAAGAGRGADAGGSRGAVGSAAAAPERVGDGAKAPETSGGPAAAVADGRQPDAALTDLQAGLDDLRALMGQPNAASREPTVDVMRKAVDRVGAAAFERMVEDKLADLGELSDEERAAEIEGVARDVVDGLYDEGPAAQPNAAAPAAGDTAGAAGGKPPVTRSAGPVAAAPRTLNEDGRASDGKPILPGDVFATLSGRKTTPYPKQKGEKYASQWLIDNAVAEAKSRGDNFNETGFGGERPLRDGTLPPASRESMLMYLFGEQPAVPPSILRPLSPASAAPASAAATTGASDEERQGQGRRQEVLTPAAGKERDQRKPAAAKPHVYRTRDGASKARRELGNTHKIQKVKGGYILRPMTDKEIAAAQALGKRAARGKPVDPTKDDLAMAMAKLGGIERASATRDLGVHKDSYKEMARPGLPMFPREGGMNAEEAVEAAIDYGYLLPGNSLVDLEQKLADQIGGTPQYSVRKDYGQDTGPLDPFSVDDLEDAGYTDASPEVQALTEQLVAEAEALGIDTETLREDAARTTEGLSDDEYQAEIQQALKRAIAQAQADAQGRDVAADRAGDEDRGQPAGEEGAAEGLTPPTPESLQTAEQRAAEAARAAENEQRRLARQEAKERERKELADRTRQDASAEGFTLGQTREEVERAMAGNGDLFGGADDALAPKESGWASRGGQVYDLMRDGELQAQIRHAGHPTALRPYYFTGGALIDRVHPEIATIKFTDLAKAKQAADDIQAGRNPSGHGVDDVALFPTLEQLRADLRKLDDEILANAPKKFQVGGGDIEGALRHPQVPKGAKIVRQAIVDRIRLMQGKPSTAEPAAVREQMAADERAAGGNPHEWAGRAAFKAGHKRNAPAELSVENAPRWLNGFDDALGEEMDRLGDEAKRLHALQLKQPIDSDERAETIRAMDDANREISRLADMLPEEAAPEEEADDEPYEPPQNWRESMFHARTYARTMSIDPAGMDLPALVKAIEKRLKPARDSARKSATARTPDTQRQIDLRKRVSVLEALKRCLEA